MNRVLRYITWPALTGILIGIISVQMAALTGFIGLPAHQAQKTQPEQAGPMGPISYSPAIKKAAPSVVSINSTKTVKRQDPLYNHPLFRRYYTDIEQSLGSGVIVHNAGYILTSYHVIEGAEDIVVTRNDGETVVATVVGVDEQSDLAVLQVKMDNITPISFGSSDKLEVGDVVLAIGYPRNIGQSVSLGIISALNKSISNKPVDEFIQTDAAINPGNSGGALIDIQGKLIGINSRIFSGSGGSEGIGFAIPVKKAIYIMQAIIEFGRVTRGYLGVETGDLLTKSLSLKFFGTPNIQGILVEKVEPDGPAEKAGIKAGDVMTALNSMPIHSVSDTVNQINRNKPGDKVMIQIFRRGRYINIPTILGRGDYQTRFYPDDIEGFNPFKNNQVK